MAGGFHVQGLREVVRGLEQVGVGVDDLKDAFQPISQDAASIAAGFVQSRSGRLAGTIRGNRAKNKAVVTAGRSSVPYAGPQNYGWKRRNIPAQGFMQKADEQMRPVVLHRLDSAIDALIRRNGL